LEALIYAEEREREKTHTIFTTLAIL